MKNGECRTRPNLRATRHSSFTIHHSSLDASASQRRLFADGRFFTPDARAIFLFDEPVRLPEPTDANFPFLLMTGRASSAQWHTGSRTNKSAVLLKLASRAHGLEINPTDAERLGITSGSKVTITSRRGQATAIAFVTPIVSPGQIYMGMHSPEVNRLTFPSFDPHSRQPAYKACAVKIAPTA
jgi:assimilatory nitrate reductase catalytic subunit